MPTLLERYVAGEHEAVWRELVARGDAVRADPLAADALAVAREFARRAFANARTLHRRLVDLGYRFARPDVALVPAGEDAPARVEAMQHKLGVFPLSVRAWYEVFHSLDFTQARDQLRESDGSDVCGLGSHPAMIMHDLDTAWRAFEESIPRYHEQRKRFLEDCGHEWPAEPTPFLAVGGFASNCEQKAFELPDAGADGVFYNDGGGDVYFVAAMRRCFEWGGFPFCRYYLEGGKTVPFEARPNAERLVPILKDGLLPV